MRNQSKIDSKQVLPLLQRIGGGHDAAGPKLTGYTMLFGRDTAFDEHDHELYDLQEDSHELVNLVLGRGLGHDMRVLASQNCGQSKVQSKMGVPPLAAPSTPNNLRKSYRHRLRIWRVTATWPTSQTRRK